MKNIQVTGYCRHMMELQVRPGDLCIDATVGNGHDTAYLAELVGDSGHVIGFDIQKEALANARGRIPEEFQRRVTLHCRSHERIAEYAKPETVSCIVFNFGYLPGGDHLIATRAETSLAAVKASLPLLRHGGLLLLTLYSGGDTGYEERDTLLRWAAALDPKEYLVLRTEYYNRRNDPPMPVMVIRL